MFSRPNISGDPLQVLREFKPGDVLTAEVVNALVLLATREVTGPHVRRHSRGWHVGSSHTGSSDVSVLAKVCADQYAGLVTAYIPDPDNPTDPFIGVWVKRELVPGGGQFESDCRPARVFSYGVPPDRWSKVPLEPDNNDPDHAIRSVPNFYGGMYVRVSEIAGVLWVTTPNWVIQAC